MRQPKPSIIQQAPPVAKPAPPVQRQAEDVVQAGIELRQREQLKKGVRSTVKAGETGGWGNPLKGAPNESMMSAGYSRG